MSDFQIWTLACYGLGWVLGFICGRSFGVVSEIKRRYRK